MRRLLMLIGTVILIAIVFNACGGDDDNPTTSTNSAPGQPALDSSAGGPADGATGVSLTPVLKWTCTDPDGNTLTYTVSFGTVSPPPVVSTDQAAGTYSPASLAYSTAYFWSVTAKDPSGDTTGSDVWGFTTMAQPTETVSVPNSPTGPAIGYEDQNLSYSAGGSVSNLGDNLEYRFDWGDGNFSTWGTIAVVYSWTISGPYEVKAQARCVAHTATVSVWSAATSVVISVAPTETVSLPDTPTGDSTGLENEDLEFTASGSISNLGDDLEYRFDWGDGNFSAWATTSIQNSWTTAGTYEVKAQARCVAHPSFISDWSTAFTVTISAYAPETITTPNIPTGASTGETGQSIGFSTSGAVSSDGHTLAYKYDWGDGTFSNWVAQATSNHGWSTAGTYDVKVQARCMSHTAILSAWSGAKTIIITQAAGETVSAPDTPTGPATGETDANLVFYNEGGAISSDGHQLEYRFDFGDGDITNWYYNWISIQHSYDTVGTYDVKMQARCQTHIAIESAWSTPLSIEITLPPETLNSLPGAILGVDEGQINESYEYDCIHGSVTNLGDLMEGQWDWGDGTTSAWVTWQERAQSHMWTTEDTYVVKYVTRCVVHNDFSYEADSLVVTIVTEVTETITKPGFMSGNVSPTVGDEVTYFVQGSVSSLGHALEYKFDWGDGSAQSDWFAQATQIPHTWNVIGTFDMIRQARCVDHPDIMSEWSDPKVVYVRDFESVSAPDAPTGPTSGIIDAPMFYDLFGAASSYYHNVEYRLDWGDGSAYTAWSNDTTRIYHVFTTPGDYEVKAQARCSYNTEVESEWSQATVISILELITLHGGIYGRENGAINESYTFDARYPATSSEGHAVEYSFDFGDGTISDWSLALTASHAFTAVGSYDVKFHARCVDHPAAESDWTYRLRIVITDDPEALEILYIQTVSPSIIHIGTEASFSVLGSESNYGDSLEYRVDFGDGNVSDWSATTWSNGFDSWTAQLKHTYAAIGSYDALAQARCVEHPSIVSDWSAIKVVEVIETIETIPVPTGPLTGLVGENLEYTTVGTTSDAGHDLEYSFMYTRGPSLIHESDWSTSLTDDHVFTTAHTQYKVRVKARCIAHPAAIKYSFQTAYIVITAP